MTLAGLLAGSGLDRLESGVLAAHVLGVDRAWLVAHDRDTVEASAQAAIEALYARRRAGEPISYLTGTREFYGLALEVNDAVLIPRPETELLVDRALDGLPRGARACDLGTGSGAIAVAIASARPDAEVWAVDASPRALAVARANAARHAPRITFVESDWFDAFEPRLFHRAFDLLVSNPPYLADADPHLARGDLRFEPRGALAAGPTGLEAIERIARTAGAFLASGGRLLLEHGYDQGDSVPALLRATGWVDVVTWPDDAGHPRVTAARRADPVA